MTAAPAPPARAGSATRRLRALEAVLAIAVAVAFADSSIIVLALPDLYAEFSTTIEGVALVITGYNVVVALVAFALVPLVRRMSPVVLLRTGLAVFAAASVGCGASTSLGMLVGFRLVQGAGAAALLAGALPLLRAMSHLEHRGGRVWMTAGTVGAALGPALGGVITQVLDWRAIFLVQAPVAAVALVAAWGPHTTRVERDEGTGSLRPTLIPNLGLLLVFGALVGALFLAVLLVITVWGHPPVAGAAIVSALPAGTLAVGRLAAALGPRAAACGGAALLAGGLAALALLPSTDPAFAALALALCGCGLGLAVPTLSGAAVRADAGRLRSGTFSIAARHAGLVLALAAIAPLLSSDLDAAGETAKTAATTVILEGRIGIQSKVPVALGVRDEFEAAQAGRIPDLARPFEENGAGNDARVAAVRDDLVDAVESTITRAFRPSFLFAALLAALAILPGLALRRRAPA